MKMLKKHGYLFIVIGIAVILFAPKGGAQTFTSGGNPLDTVSGEVMKAVATYETLNYKDALGNSKPATYPASDISHTVSPEYGFSMNVDLSNEVIVTPGDVYNYSVIPSPYYITNEGNAYLNYTGSYLYTQNGATNWTVEVYRDVTQLFSAPLTPGIVSIDAQSLAEDKASGVDSYKPTHYVIKVNPLAANSPNGSFIEVFTTFETTSKPVGTYEGANKLIYGGTSEAHDYSKYLVAAPEMVISRTSTIDSPVVYKTNGGGANDPVPGAVVTYTMTVSNLGSTNALNAIIIDRITTKEGESGTNLAHVNATGNRVNVNLTAAAGSATGWTAYYTTEATLATGRTTYEAPGWTMIGTVSGASPDFPDVGLYTYSSAEFAAKWIKWEKSSVASTEDTATLVWGVTIR